MLAARKVSPMLSSLLTRHTAWRIAIVVVLTALTHGCHSPYRSEKGALYGGLGGAGLGAIVGNAVGNTARALPSAPVWVL